MKKTGIGNAYGIGTIVPFSVRINKESVEYLTIAINNSERDAGIQYLVFTDSELSAIPIKPIESKLFKSLQLGELYPHGDKFFIKVNFTDRDKEQSIVVVELNALQMIWALNLSARLSSQEWFVERWFKNEFKKSMLYPTNINQTKELDMLPIDLSNFEEVTKEGTSVIMFGATWCGPCKTMPPVIATTKKMLTTPIKFFKADVESDDGKLAQQHRVKSVPYFVVYKDGEIIDTFDGTRTADQLTDHLESLISDY